MTDKPRPVIVPVLKFLATRTTVPMWERFTMWSLVLVCAFSGGDGNSLHVGASAGAAWISTWWPFGS